MAAPRHFPDTVIEIMLAIQLWLAREIEVMYLDLALDEEDENFEILDGTHPPERPIRNKESSSRFHSYQISISNQENRYRSYLGWWEVQEALRLRGDPVLRRLYKSGLPGEWTPHRPV